MSAPEFSRLIEVEQLPPGGSDFAIEAGAAERAALAARFGIVAVDALAAEMRLVPLAGGMVRLEGRVRAEVRQACVVTLAEVPAKIDQTFARLYAPADPDQPAEVIVQLDDEVPDPLVDGTIDIGEAAAEEVALSLDPYPRAPGAAFEGVPGDKPDPPSPFAALKSLKR